MTSQILLDRLSSTQPLRESSHSGPASAAVSAAAGAVSGDVCALADAIIDRIRNDDATRFLERVRQSPGE